MALTKVQSEMSNATAPAFYATRTTVAQTFTTSTTTKVQFNTEVFDTNSNYDPTTNYRFTPTVAGYYQINALVCFAGSAAGGYAQTYIYKNGASFIAGNASANNTSTGGCSSVSGIVYCDGVTDYIEIYAWQNSGGDLATQTSVNGNRVNFSGVLVRPA